MSDSAALVAGLAVLATGVAFALIIGWALVKARGILTERQKELWEWARANDLTFNPAKDPSLGPRFCRVVSMLGYHGAGWNVIEGVYRGRAVCAFDYRYADNDCRSAVVVDAGLPLKRLIIGPRGAMGSVGYDVPSLESIEFNDKYVVLVKDRRWAYDVLSQKTMELLLHNDYFFIELDGTKAVAHGGTKQYFRPRDFRCALEVLTGMLDNLPEAVVRELKGIDSGGVLS
jgi:hypothetical protein